MEPSLDAFGMTVLAVMSYQTTPWEELAKKPSILKTLKYVAIRGGNNYDEIEALTKDLMCKHFDGITLKKSRGIAPYLLTFFVFISLAPCIRKLCPL